jgi:hypothetical protein
MPISLKDFLEAEPGRHQLVGRGCAYRVMSVVKPPLIGLATLVVEDINHTPLVVSLNDTHHLVDPGGTIIETFNTQLARIEEVPPFLLTSGQ